MKYTKNNPYAHNLSNLYRNFRNLKNIDATDEETAIMFKDYLNKTLYYNHRRIPNVRNSVREKLTKNESFLRDLVCEYRDYSRKRFNPYEINYREYLDVYYLFYITQVDHADKYEFEYSFQMKELSKSIERRK